MHSGKVVAQKGKYEVIECDACKFKHLYPIPTQEELTQFYTKNYFDLIKKGGRAPEIRRQMVGGEEQELEMEWLERTLYTDILVALNEHIQKEEKLLLDIGTGMGKFIRYMKQNSWNVVGIEPDEKNTKCDDLEIHKTSLKEFTDNHSDYKEKFDAITILSVLEHVSDPIDFINMSKALLKPKTGIICIRVPNDFNELQKYAEKNIEGSLWWVTPPDHINYFNSESLKELLKHLDFDVVGSGVDFPMELFLLMGEDYVGNSDMGSLCHKKRVNLELAISGELRRKIYKGFESVGLGRDCIVYARLR